jgi:hypothetical protein
MTTAWKVRMALDLQRRFCASASSWFDTTPTLPKFKRQIVHAYLSGKTRDGPTKSHDVSRNLIRVWLQKREHARNQTSLARWSTA